MDRDRATYNTPMLNTFEGEDHYQVLHSMHMPAHCNNNSTTPRLNKHLEKGGNRIEGTTDDYFGLLGNYFPPSGRVKDSLEHAAKLYNTA